ncbi:MAG: lipoyl(octanoyl) transferase LipB [Flavobacteriaceae bacterium]|nr:lipoyl(octanoyl) transferase LipB [Flavobacteriaceae bacterium]
MNKNINIQDWGLIAYKEAWDKQEALFAETVSIKLENRNELRTKNDEVVTNNFLIFCQHPHVYTLGKSGDKTNLLIPDSMMKEKDISYFPINRGGDITYHGPGQLVGYLIFDLDNFFTDIHKFLRYLEEAIILTLAEYNIKAGRIAGLTGVWLDLDHPAKSRKICAMGIRASRWVTMHGFALNINTDLSYYSYINPCGITDKAVTSMEKELGQEVSMEDVQEKLGSNLLSLFQ